MSGKNIGIVVVLLILVGGGSFYGGMQYQKSQTPARGSFAGAGGAGGAAGAAGARGGFGGRTGGGLTQGTVVSKDAQSLTLETRTGSSMVVFYTTSTSVGEMTTSSINDVANGASVTVVGTTNSDGSITASSIQLRPAGMPGFGGPGGGNASGTPPTGGAPTAAPANQ